MWVVVLGLLIAIGFLAFLIASCRQSPAWARRVRWWGAPPSDAHLAERRAQALLRALLSKTQYCQVHTAGYLEVPSPTLEGRVYRIPSMGGLVSVYEHGSVIMGLCLQPTQPLPKEDVVIMHKLLIEASEQEYLQKAHRLPPGAIRPQREAFPPPRARE